MADTREILERALAYWCAQDVESTLSMMTDDVVYELNVPDSVLPYGGVTSGKEALRAAMFAMHVDWTYLETQVLSLATEGEAGRAHVRFKYHHNRSGRAIAGTLRFVFTVRDGLISRVVEIQDKALIEAFLAIPTDP